VLFYASFGFKKDPWCRVLHKRGAVEERKKNDRIIFGEDKLSVHRERRRDHDPLGKLVIDDALRVPNLLCCLW
jgi:hypothetical protein